MALIRFDKIPNFGQTQIIGPFGVYQQGSGGQKGQFLPGQITKVDLARVQLEEGEGIELTARVTAGQVIDTTTGQPVLGPFPVQAWCDIIWGNGAGEPEKVSIPIGERIEFPTVGSTLIVVGYLKSQDGTAVPGTLQCKMTASVAVGTPALPSRAMRPAGMPKGTPFASSGTISAGPARITQLIIVNPSETANLWFMLFDEAGEPSAGDQPILVLPIPVAPNFATITFADYIPITESAQWAVSSTSNTLDPAGTTIAVTALTAA